MALVLAFDTETTGLFPKYYSVKDVHKLPHMVQLGAVLFDNVTWEEHGVIDKMIIPEGFEITEENSALHGVSHSDAVANGYPLRDAVEEFEDLRSKAVGLIAHNIEYDQRMMVVNFHRLDIDPASFIQMPKKCTMKSSTDICKLPGKVPGKYKWPKLQEVYLYLFGKEFEGAHNAYNDIKATIEVYRELRRLNAI